MLRNKMVRPLTEELAEIGLDPEKALARQPDEESALRSSTSGEDGLVTALAPRGAQFVSLLAVVVHQGARVTDAEMRVRIVHASPFTGTMTLSMPL